MLAVKGGTNKRIPKKIAREAPKEIQEAIPNKIVVRPEWVPSVPGSVFRTSGFNWDPVGFAVESDRLHEKIYDPEVQTESLQRFIEEPDGPMIYGVTGNPSEAKARYFAAYLVHIHCRAVTAPNILWHTLYGGYDNKVLRDYEHPDVGEPTMVVITNLATNSTASKFEKARDILERFSKVPCVVVAAGEDPISFLSTRLYVPCHGIAYFSEALVKRRVEVL